MNTLLCFTLILGVSHVVYGSAKKGVAINRASFMCDDLKVLNMAWWYDWGQTVTHYENDLHCHDHMNTHVPMIWGWHSGQHYSIPNTAQAVLGFNEPNFRAQSNMTPQQAVTHWRELEANSNGRPLVSPAAAPCGSSSQCHGDAKVWFDEFFKLCTGCRIDYLATHAYWCDASITMNYLRDLHNRYGKKIWLTEFACPYTSDPNKQLAYMKSVLPQLEAADYVYRYSWFTSRVRHGDNFITTSVNLVHIHHSQLTPLGQYYNDFNGGSAVVGK